MTDITKQKFKYWLIGLFTGGAITAPITTYITKKICDNKNAEAMEKAVDEAEDRGINAMAAYVAEQELANKSDNTSPNEEDINNYDVEIDDVGAMEEARERTEAHERYLDMIDKYNGTITIPPYKIDAEKFITEQYMEKSYVNWYSYDNVFEEGLDIIEDPYMTFGVTNGADLFRDEDTRDDPNICYVRNESRTIDFEITRIFGSYAQMVGGEHTIGQTDT